MLGGGGGGEGGRGKGAYGEEHKGVAIEREVGYAVGGEAEHSDANYELDDADSEEEFGLGEDVSGRHDGE